MDTPMTSESDLLREEIEMLAAENRRLLDQVHELRKAPTYPEAAVRAVWEHGQSMPYGCCWEIRAEEIAQIFVEALRDA